MKNLADTVNEYSKLQKVKEKMIMKEYLKIGLVAVVALAIAKRIPMVKDYL